MVVREKERPLVHTTVNMVWYERIRAFFFFNVRSFHHQVSFIVL